MHSGLRNSVRYSWIAGSEAWKKSMLFIFHCNACLRCEQGYFASVPEVCYMVSRPPCFGPIVALYIMVGVRSGGILFTSWKLESQSGVFRWGSKGRRRRVQSLNKDMALVTQLSSIMTHLLKTILFPSRI